MPRRALITGITGQVGPYLAELLMGEGYEVYNLAAASFVPLSWQQPEATTGVTRSWTTS